MLAIAIIIAVLLLLVVLLLYCIARQLNKLLIIADSQGNRPDNTICRYFHSTKKRRALTPHQKALKAWQDKGK